LAGKREPAQIFHEVLDYRWYASQRENREVPLVEATQGYIADVLASLPDEAQTTDPAATVEGNRELLNPYDPSQGFADDEEEPPYDPWEAEAHAPDMERLPDHLDIDALRRRASLGE
jgi:hypothetical protein